MTYEVSYKGDNTGRRAINDLIRWFGLDKSKMIYRAVRDCHNCNDLDSVNMAISMGGVSGEPVRRLIAHIHGEATLEMWSKEPVGSQRVLHQAAYV